MYTEFRTGQAGCGLKGRCSEASELCVHLSDNLKPPVCLPHGGSSAFKDVSGQTLTHLKDQMTHLASAVVVIPPVNK